MAITVDQTIEKGASDCGVHVTHDHFGNVLLLRAAPAMLLQPSPKNRCAGEDDHARASHGPPCRPSKASHDLLNPAGELDLVSAEGEPHVRTGISFGDVEP